MKFQTFHSILLRKPLRNTNGCPAIDLQLLGAKLHTQYDNSVRYGSFNGIEFLSKIRITGIEEVPAILKNVPAVPLSDMSFFCTTGVLK